MLVLPGFWAGTTAESRLHCSRCAVVMETLALCTPSHKLRNSFFWGRCASNCAPIPFVEPHGKCRPALANNSKQPLGLHSKSGRGYGAWCRGPRRHKSATLPSGMPDLIQSRRNWALWLGFLLALGALLCNAVFFVNLPGQRAIPWLSVLLAGVSLIFLVRGLQRAFGQPPVHRGKILSSMLALISLLLVGVAIFSFFQARAIPASAGAPKVGQTAPDFTLADTSGQLVSMAQLFAPAADESQVVPPKAVLLIFYRGYW